MRLLCKSRGVTTVAEDESDLQKRLNRDWVTWWSYKTALRQLLRLAAPGALVCLPIGVLAMLGAIPVFGDVLVVVNGQLTLIGPGSGPTLVWSAAALVLLVIGQAVAFSATVILAAGALIGRPVSVTYAMRAAVRRLPAITASPCRSIRSAGRRSGRRL